MNFKLNQDLIVFNIIEKVVRLELIQFNVFKYLTLFLLYLVGILGIEPRWLPLSNSGVTAHSRSIRDYIPFLFWW